MTAQAQPETRSQAWRFMRRLDYTTPPPGGPRQEATQQTVLLAVFGQVTQVRYPVLSQSCLPGFNLR